MRFKERQKAIVKVWVARIVLFLLLIVIIIGLFFFLAANFFYIKNLEIKTEGVTCALVKDLKNTSQLLGRNIFFLDKKRIENKLREKYFCVKNISLSVRFPDKMEMKVMGRKAVLQVAVLPEKESSSSAIIENFLIKDSSESSKENLDIKEKYLVDEEGILFSKDQIDSLKKLYVYNNLTLGQKLDHKTFENYQEVIKKLEVLGISSGEAKIYSNIYLLLNAKPKIVIDLSGNINVQLASLQLILSRAKIEEKEMVFIDTRFENPIVKYAPKKGE